MSFFAGSGGYGGGWVQSPEDVAQNDALSSQARYRFKAAKGGMYGPSQEALDARYPHDLRQSRFNAILPMLQGGLNSNWASQAQQIGGRPTINTNPIWNPQQIQQQVNAGRAQNDMATQTQQQLAQQRVAGQGFGSNSPLAAALQGQLSAQGMATNADTERGTRMQAAQANAGHRLGAQTAWEAAYADRQRPWISMFGNQQNALLSALANLAGG